jgi:hypothetical protein
MMRIFAKILGFVGLYALINMVNDVVPFYRPGHDITCKASVGLTGRRLCAITGNRTSGPGLSSSDDPGVYQVGLPAAGGRVFGVVGRDTPSGGLVPVKREGILPVDAAGNIAAFAEVETDAAGKVITKAAGIAVGYVTTAAANGGIAEVQLYNR